MLTGAAIYAAPDVFQRALAFSLLPVFALRLDPADFGVLGLTYTLTGLLGSLLGLGLSQSVVRFGSSPDDRGLRSLVGVIWPLLLGLGSVIVLLLASLGPPFWGVVLSKLAYNPFVLLALTSAWCNVAVIDVRLATYRASQRPVPHASLVTLKLFIANGLSLWLVFAHGRGARGVIEGQTAAAVMVALIAAGSLARETRWRLDWAAARAPLRFGVALAPRSLAAWSLRMSDRVVLDRFVSLQSIGGYTVANQLSSALQVAVTGLSLAASPEIARSRRDESQRRRVSDALELSITLLVSAAVGGALLARIAVDELLPTSFSVASPLIPYLFLGVCYSGLVALLTQVLAFGLDRPLAATSLTIGGAALNLALALALVPNHGAKGAAISTLAAYAAMAAAAWWAQRRTGWLSARSVLGAGVVSALAMTAAWTSMPSATGSRIGWAGGAVALTWLTQRLLWSRNPAQ